MSAGASRGTDSWLHLTAVDGSPCKSYVLKIHNAHESALTSWIEVRVQGQGPTPEPQRMMAYECLDVSPSPRHPQLRRSGWGAHRNPHIFHISRHGA